MAGRGGLGRVWWGRLFDIRRSGADASVRFRKPPHLDPLPLNGARRKRRSACAVVRPAHNAETHPCPSEEGNSGLSPSLKLWRTRLRPGRHAPTERGGTIRLRKPPHLDPLPLNGARRRLRREFGEPTAGRFEIQRPKAAGTAATTLRTARLARNIQKRCVFQDRTQIYFADVFGYEWVMQKRRWVRSTKRTQVAAQAFWPERRKWGVFEGKMGSVWCKRSEAG